MSGHHRDYYKTLQVDAEAEPEVIAAAYRRLSLKYHPDTNTAADATLRMQQINEAYDVLRDPGKRARYDRERAGWASGFGLAEDDQWREAAPGGPWRGEKARAEPESAVHAFRAAPRGAKTVKAFSAEQLYCDGNRFQETTLPGGCWIDLSFEWIAREVATVTSTWSALAVAVTIDNEAIEHPKRNPKGPDAAVLHGTKGSRYGYVVADALFVPPLPLGDHTVRWTVGFTRDVDDGWTIHPRGSELVVTSFLHIVKTV